MMEDIRWFIWRIMHMPEVYAPDEDLVRVRTCLSYGFKALLVSILFWIVMGAFCWSALTTIGG